MPFFDCFPRIATDTSPCFSAVPYFLDDGTCQPEVWPDKDHDLVCGDCKVLVDNFSSKYKTCDGYCSSIGAICVDAWEETGDSCNVKHDLRCAEEMSPPGPRVDQIGTARFYE